MTHGLGVQNAQSLSDVTVILKENCQVPFFIVSHFLSPDIDIYNEN
jgi:hypothetical protein